MGQPLLLLLIGVRTPWTLSSDENWLRTHRVGAYAFAAGGAVALVAGGVGGHAGAAVGISAMVASALVPLAYSFVMSRRLG